MPKKLSTARPERTASTKPPTTSSTPISTKPRIKTVVTDLDNTLFDWVEMWGTSFTALLAVLLRSSGIPRDELLPEIRAVHQRHHTAEYAFLLQQLPSLKRLHPNEDVTVVYADAIQAYKDARASSLRLYPGARETLDRLKAAGCRIIGYTESQSFYSSYRIRTLGLDGVLDALFSPADHDRPDDFKRSKPDDAYGLLRTRHEHTPPGEYKPNPDILLDILRKVDADKETSIYVGDSLMKDVAMAQDAGVRDVHAKYGEATHREVYELLRLVTHWSDEDVERERRINARGSVTPTYVLRKSISELFNFFEFTK